MTHTRIHIKKEYLKFSAAHMTIFPDGTKECLHGHNYTSEFIFDLKENPDDRFISFSTLKEPIRELCAAWDERVLLPAKSPFLKLLSKTNLPEETEFMLCEKRYVLPSEDVVWLPVSNITTETLAQQMCADFVAKQIPNFLTSAFTAIHVRIEETPGQGATVTWTS